MHSPWRRFATLLTAVIADAAAASCGVTADPGQKALVDRTPGEIPEDVTRALNLGEVKLRYQGKSGSDVAGDRKIGLSPGPAPATTTGAWVQGCRSLVAALAGTSALVYGRMPGLDPLHEATDDLCLRGIGHQLGSSGTSRLILGLTGADGRVTDTAIDVDAAGLLLSTDGRDQRPQGAPLDVAEPDTAAWDAALTGEELPWRYDSGPPARTQTSATFVGGTSPEGSAAACGTRLDHELRPQLTYTTADGREVDRYDLIVMPALHLNRTGEPPIRTVTVDHR